MKVFRKFKTGKYKGYSIRIMNDGTYSLYLGSGTQKTGLKSAQECVIEMKKQFI